MQRAELQLRLQESHQRFLQYVKSLSVDDFEYSYSGKWTAGQQLDHIIKSVSPVAMALTLPPFLLRISFGNANRSSRSYDELVTRYQQKLAAGGRSTTQFLPRNIQYQDREKLIASLQNKVERLCKLTNRFSEASLDLLILPHPLLGKLTVREMLYFTIYHVQHHEKNMREHLSKK